ncbi:MAG: haloacid dehalogenase [Candidatus Tectimicrobiota bacterium]|nr:MAG: haloacid dehalogenase [Candidatus Tectomicrobia bacterium]
MLDWRRFGLLTFDCYGTLIDWERGVVEAVRPLLAARGLAADEAAILAAFGRHEAHVERELAPRCSPPLLYKEVLILTLAALAADFGFTPTAAELLALRQSLPRWAPFPEVPAALQALQRRYRLAVLSNVDDDLFAFSQAQLGVDFAWVVTAQQVGRYKPDPAHFHAILARSGLPAGRILHVAQSPYHDLGVAKALGFATVWVNRRQSRLGLTADAQPDLEVPDLAALVACLEGEAAP